MWCRRNQTYQLTKELFPAEWFPISMTVIFLRGGNRVTPTDWAIVIRPEDQKKICWGINNWVLILLRLQQQWFHFGTETSEEQLHDIKAGVKQYTDGDKAGKLWPSTLHLITSCLPSFSLHYQFIHLSSSFLHSFMTVITIKEGPSTPNFFPFFVHSFLTVITTKIPWY